MRLDRRSLRQADAAGLAGSRAREQATRDKPEFQSCIFCFEQDLREQEDGTITCGQISPAVDRDALFESVSGFARDLSCGNAAWRLGRLFGLPAEDGPHRQGVAAHAVPIHLQAHLYWERVPLPCTVATRGTSQGGA